ncbi:sensor histidine kinase [Inhella crocodyli]|nr:histidine kinase [Inhella crocodyli]
MPPAHALPQRRPFRRLWLAYALLCLMCWLLYAVAGTDWQRDAGRFWFGLYEATWNLGPAFLLGPLAWPWTRALQQRPRRLAVRLGWHALGAVVFAALWQGLDVATAWLFFGAAHASATFEQGLVWRGAWGLFVYGVLVFGFGGVLNAQRAHSAALKAAQTEAALVRAELSAISGKLNPHFLFNTLNSLLMLVRRDPARAESALLGFSRMMRYVLDSTRLPDARVSLREELGFVRDYLALEQLRLGPRLRVEWDIAPEAEDEALPPLSLQPLVENAVGHGIAPQVDGGLLTIRAQCSPQALHLRVQDDGAGCEWPRPSDASPTGRGIGLSALQRRFELDYDGRAGWAVSSAPGQGFTVDIHLPRS